MGKRKRGFVKKRVPLLVATLLSGVAVAATHTVPSSVDHPMPLEAKQTSQQTAHVPFKQLHASGQNKQLALAQPTIINTPSAPAKPPVEVAPAKPAPVYADTAPANTKSGSQPMTASDVNTNIPYTSVLPKDAEIVPGAPGKNEFFIVAAEDAAKIKQLIDHTKPGREVVASEIKSKQPIVKVKLDESNSTLVAMDVVTSVKTVAAEAAKKSVQMTAEDEVMSIYTKNKITPIGSRVVAVATPKTTSTKIKPDPMEEKPMLKLLAATSAPNNKEAKAKTDTVINPLEATRSVKPSKGAMPDTVAIKETIEQPEEKPVALPLASKEPAPTLEMVLQQAKNTNTKGDDAATRLAKAVLAADAKAKKPVETKSVSKAVASTAKAAIKPDTKADTKSTTKVTAKATSKVADKATTKATAKVADKATNTKVTAKVTSKPATKPTTKPKTIATKQEVKKAPKKKVAAGKVIPYEEIKPATKKGPWGTRHAAAPTTKKVSNQKVATTKKGNLHVGVVRSYSDYLSKTGHRAKHTTE